VGGSKEGGGRRGEEGGGKRPMAAVNEYIERWNIVEKKERQMRNGKTETERKKRAAGAPN
jgi:hypothetical protein